jgi:hypothetical protein
VARWDNRCENASPTGSAENEIPIEIVDNVPKENVNDGRLLDVMPRILP